MIRAYVGLGANLGDALTALVRACRSLARQPGIRMAACSSIYQSAPVDAAGPDFLNAVCAIDTTLDALSLLNCLQSIEADAGRERPYRNAPRTLDLDLLMYADLTMDSDRLVLPHPRLHERRFVLQPLAELAPDIRLRLPDGTMTTAAQQLGAIVGQAISRRQGPEVFVSGQAE